MPCTTEPEKSYSGMCAEESEQENVDATVGGVLEGGDVTF